ncbi:dethiobiotin synthase [Marinobacteraceae bacterium S3BR75-40.1]
MARKTFFVTGTDTGVGKTLVSVALLEKARQLGLRTLAVKPVAAGCEKTEEGLRNEDAVALRAAITEKLSYEQVNPVALPDPLSPHIAAHNVGVSVSIQRLAGFCRGVMSQPGDLCLIEGAGGWRVPLNERETLARLPRELDIPVLMVVPLQLGCLNHAFLTAEAIGRDGLKLAGWVGNHPHAEPMAAEAENIATLKAALPAPCLGILPWQSAPGYQTLSQSLDTESLKELIEK